MVSGTPTLLAASASSLQWSEITVSIELPNTADPSIGAEVRALVEHALSDKAGDWRVSIVGSRENDGWEMTILGPNGFERSYTLVEARESTSLR
jgi:hypothetical protein